MNHNRHKELIQQLTHNLKPVAKTPNLWLGTATWSLVFLGLGVLSTFLLNLHPKAWQFPATQENILSFMLCIVIGCLSISNVFKSQIPGRQLNTTLLNTMIIFWLVASLFSIFTVPHHIGHFGQGLSCYLFVVTSGIPMLIISLMFLKKNQSLIPLKTLKYLSIGIIFLSYSLLTLCHSEQLILNDFFMHLFAAMTLIGLTVFIGYRFFQYRQ